MINKTVVNNTFFCENKKKYLEKSFDVFFRDRNETFSKNSEENLVFFDEVIIIQIIDNHIEILFDYPKRGDNRFQELNYTEMIKIIRHFKEKSGDPYHCFMKDQSGKNFDYISNHNLKSKDIHILLNNKEFSFDELEEKYPECWKAMNADNHYTYNDLSIILKGID